jgi:formate hydrogenlyase subunit 6/NADH:ubiquinone oxidoreductase subunit I
MKILRRFIQWSAFLIFSIGFLPLIPLWTDKLSGTLVNLQFFPALLRLGVIPVIIIIVTLVFGRIYCSTLCPLASVQDCFIGTKQRFSFRKLAIWKRYLIPLLSMIILVAGFPAIASSVDPYSAAGRIFSTISELLVTPLINFTALILRNLSVYIISTPFKFRWLTIIYSGIFLGLIILMSRIGGRLYCNTICPVGAILSIPGRFAIFSHRINPSKCTACGACEQICKAEAIDSKSKRIDSSKCVSCFNCIRVCNFDALSYGLKKTARKESDSTRRSFLKKGAAASLLLLTAPLWAKSGTKPDVDPAKSAAATPPGSLSRNDFLSKCIACSLCISRCPGEVLQPALLSQYGLRGMGVPYMDYNKGACNFNCNLCTELCPSGAIQPLQLAVKQQVKIGEAVFVREFCVVETDGTSCGACGEICPSGAIEMIHIGEGDHGALEIPRIEKVFCIGCGSCQFVCPVIAKNTIFVQALDTHERAEIREKRDPTPTDEIDNGFAF